MNAVPEIETPQAGARRLCSRYIAEGFEPVALHPYTAPDGTPLFFRVRLKHPDGRKVIRPMHLDGLRFVMGEPKAPKGGKPLYGLADLVAADPDATIWIGEGENKADALAKVGKVATTSGGASSADAADWTPLRGRKVIVWPDNDGPGANYADAVAAKLQALGCAVQVVEVAALNLPTGGDAVDWLAENPAGNLDSLALTKPTKGAFGSSGSSPDRPLQEIEPLPDSLPLVPAFDPSLLPDAVRDWCEDASDGLQVPPDFTAIPAMVGLAGAIGRSVAVALRQNGRWYEAPVLWGCVIGRPSSGKSPALAPTRRMLDRLAEGERAQHESEMRAYEAREMVGKAAKANAKDAVRAALKKGDKDKAEAAAAAALFEDEPPAEPRIVVNDATIEKLGELLNGNPRGLVQFRDELAGWLASLDREGREGDRAFWLECWNGQGGFTVDRIGRGTIRIEACAAWNLGGMQPGKLAEYVRGAVRGGFADDGLMQRFQLAVYPDTPATWRYTDRAPNPAAEAKAWQTFKYLRGLTPEAIGAESAPDCALPFLRLGGEAQDLFRGWQTELMERLRAGDEPGFMESHLAKYPALAGRLALVLHLADGGCKEISGEAMARALGWCDYLEGHARRIYAPATDNGLTSAHALLHKRKALGEEFTARDVYRKGWSGLADPDAVAEGLGVLCEYGHLIEMQVETGGRPSTIYQWRASQ